MLSVTFEPFMLSVIMLNVVVLRVVAPQIIPTLYVMIVISDKTDDDIFEVENVSQN
jgi:hypothetical protein